VLPTWPGDEGKRESENVAETETEQVLPLRGFTIGVTAHRRREELALMLERRGARVVAASTMQLEPLVGEEALQQETIDCLSAPIDIMVATTGIGFRGWLEAADGWGHGEELRQRLQTAELVARGPKARGAIRTAGFVEAWTPQSEAVGEVVERLLARDLTGQRIVLQLHGEPLPEVVSALTNAGAEVIPVGVYRWSDPSDTEAVVRFIQTTLSGQLDSIVFTSAPAVVGLLKVARKEGLEDDLVDVLRHQVLVACVGMICASPLMSRGVDVILPERARLGSLVRAVTEEVPARLGRHLTVAGHDIELRGEAIIIDSDVIFMPPAPMAILRELATRPGVVFSRNQLASHLPGKESGGHAVEMAVTRLRLLLPIPELVETVVKRGYRLSCHPVLSEPA
jgi:uroporphyrinogen-III synthase